MGRSKHCSIDARWQIVHVHDAPWRPLGGCLTEKWHNPVSFPETPQNCIQFSYSGNMLILQMTHNISVTMRDRLDGWCQWTTYRNHPLRILWSRGRWRHVTPNGQVHNPEIFEAQYLGNRARYRVGYNEPPIGNHPLRVWWSRDRWWPVTQNVVPLLTNKVFKC